MSASHEFGISMPLLRQTRKMATTRIYQWRETWSSTILRSSHQLTIGLMLSSGFTVLFHENSEAHRPEVRNRRTWPSHFLTPCAHIYMTCTMHRPHCAIA